ncbi:MAG: hypothetical protein CMH58_01425 [Myxococcales bacterium]|nr:hypothetical protein [Myxococcales bacterium]
MQSNRSIAPFCVSLLLLLLANFLIPPPSSLPVPDRPLTVEILPNVPPAEPNELPFLPQRVPDQVVPEPEKATVTDAFNRRVEKETMARRSEPMPSNSRAQPPTPKESPTSSGSQAMDGIGLLGQKLDLDLDFLQAPNAPNVFGGATLPTLDVEAGDETWLNSRRIRHGGFFRRLHQSVSRHWDPNTVMRRYDPSGMLYGSEDRVTVLHLRLEADGGLAERPKIIRPSGLSMLDREAVRAVVAAAPFPNPPAELVKEGVIDLGRFSFYLQIERGTYGFRPAR